MHVNQLRMRRWFWLDRDTAQEGDARGPQRTLYRHAVAVGYAGVMRKRALGILVVALAGSVMQDVAIAGIYRWVDESGNVYFADKPSPHHPSEAVKIRINTYECVTHDTSSFDVGKKVVMYSASWCGVCKRARRYFEEKGIKFTEYDVENSVKGRAEFKRLGANGVPVILVGKQRMNGFSVDGFERLYR
jgi:glutaredoxin